MTETRPSAQTQRPNTKRQGRRGGGRASRQAARATATAETVAYLERKLPPVEMLDEDGLAQIEENAETILAEIGVAFQDFPSAIELWREAGANIDGDLVRFPGACAARSWRAARPRCTPNMLATRSETSRSVPIQRCSPPTTDLPL